MSPIVDWKQRYDDADDDADEDPFPKMLDGDAHNILGPYVATETCTVVKVCKARMFIIARHAPHTMTHTDMGKG